MSSSLIKRFGSNLYQKQIAELQGQIAELQNVCCKKDSEISVLNAHVEKLQRMSVEKECLHNDLSIRFDDLLCQKKEFEKIICDKEERIQDILDQHAIEIQLKNDLVKQNEQLIKERDELSLQYAELQNNWSPLNAKYTRQLQLADELQSANFKMGVELKHTGDLLESARSELIQLKGKFANN